MFLILLLFIVASASAQIPGGWQPQNPKASEWTTYAWKYAAPAISKHPSNKSPYALVPIQILAVRTQVVAGRNIELTIKVGPSKCLKSQYTLTQKSCPAKNGGPNQVYVVVIFEQVWTNTVKVTSIAPGKKY